ncbi:class I adenylate-forming enzyme family protein [Nocardioides ultimimeridianus]
MAHSLVSALRWWGTTKGAETAVVVGDDRVSFADLHHWSSRVGRALAARGVARGERVCVLGANSMEWVGAGLGVQKAGAVLVPLNPRLVAPELTKIIGEAGAVAVVAAPEFRGVLEDVSALGAEFDVIGFEEIADLRDGDADDFVVEIEPDDPTIILFTSGTTGLSKGVICTNRTLLSIVFEASLTEEGLRPGGSELMLLPLAFTPGLVWGLCMCTVLGSTMWLERDINPSRAVGLIEKNKIGTLFGVPFIFEALMKAPEFESADLSSLVSAFTGGAAVSVAMLEAYAAKGVKLRQIYGMTEAGGVATATLAKDFAEHPETCGTGSIFTEVKVVREDGTECDPGEPGEAILRGPGVTPGYWNDEENTKKALRDGWLYSGDLCTTTEDGRLRFLERLKDLIISGGINVSPGEIEQVIASVDGVAEVTVLAAADEKFGETPAAIVVRSGDVTTEDILERCRTQLAKYKVPSYVVFRDEPLPRLGSGKIAKVALREEYADIPGAYAKAP